MGRWEELELRKSGDVDRRGNGVRTLRDGCGIICSDEEVV